MNRQEHWNQVYQTKGSQDASWRQRRPDLSLALIATSGVGKDAGIIDVGCNGTVGDIYIAASERMFRTRRPRTC